MNKSNSSSWALMLIACAVVGAGFSYHFTLDARFKSIEQKLDQTSAALQQYQTSQDTLLSSKTEALNNLNKEVDALQSSLEPLGKVTRDQTDSLAQIHKQLEVMQESQESQQDAAKKLADYGTQLETIRHQVQIQAAQASSAAAPAPQPAPPHPAPAVTTTAAPLPATAPVPPTPVSPAPAPSAPPATASTPLPFPPHADNSVDLRPVQVSEPLDEAGSVRVLPVALPVAISDQSGR